MVRIANDDRPLLLPERFDMPNVVLLGDSVLDNHAYVVDGQDVITRLRRTLDSSWGASCLALDGCTTAGIARQLVDLPAEATHLVVSVGKNDALGHRHLIDARCPSVAQSLVLVAHSAEEFHTDYARMLDTLLAIGLPAAVCSIFDPRYPDPYERTAVKAALAIFNDVIFREAAVRGVPVLDLRLICDEDADFATPIELSEHGGAKVASAITSLIGRHDFSRARCEIYGAS